MRSAVLRKLGILLFILPFSMASMCGLFFVDPAGVGNGMEGVWIVTEVCAPLCGPIPATGYVLPENKGTVRSLSLVFNSPVSGSVIGRYQMVVNGAGQPLKRQTGSFVYDGNDPGEVTLSALNKVITGKVVGAKGFKSQFATLEVQYSIEITDPLLGGKVQVSVTVRLRR